MRHEHRRRAEEAQRIMKRLLSWEQFMGGWEGEVWDEVRQFVADGEEVTGEEERLTECCGAPYNPDWGGYCPSCS